MLLYRNSSPEKIQELIKLSVDIATKWIEDKKNS